MKKRLNRALNEFLEPIRERRRELESKPGLVEELLVEGSRRTRREARRTIDMVREAMGMTFGLRQMLTDAAD